MLSTPDIMPTLLGLAGLESRIPDTAEGHDLSPIFLEDGRECTPPSATLYMRNLDGEKAPDGTVSGFFPEARGVRTDRYTMEISVNRDMTLKRVLIFDNLNDPYQLENIPYKDNPELFRSLCGALREKLAESDDIWHREKVMERLFEDKL